ncbi:hypothetical protein WDU94_005916 [Cyamophila willieti]
MPVILSVTALYQVTFTHVNTVYAIGNIVVILQFNYLLYTGSELIDSGVANVHRSVLNNLWYTCDPNVWKLLRPVLLMSQKPRHFKFMGFYKIDYRSFTSNLRITYSLYVIFVKFS